MYIYIYISDFQLAGGHLLMLIQRADRVECLRFASVSFVFRLTFALWLDFSLFLV